MKMPAVKVRKGKCKRRIGRILDLAGHRGDAFFCASIDGVEVGGIAIASDEEFDQVRAVEVVPEAQRKGVGTALYTAAAKRACAAGKLLRSDEDRSDLDEAFWRKQRQKGRATAIFQGGADESIELEESGVDLDDVNPDNYEKSDYVYSLKKCGKLDLSGLRRRGR